jgi:hypothetical protein
MCATPGTGQIIARVFYAPFLFEIFLVCITAFRAWEDYRRHPDGSNTPLFYVLYRGGHSCTFSLVPLIYLIDGAIFFFVIAGFRLWNIWIVRDHLVSPSSFPDSVKVSNAAYDSNLSGNLVSIHPRLLFIIDDLL